jgi:hypothetical protein
MSGLSQQCDELLEFLQSTIKELQPESIKGQDLGRFAQLGVGEHAVMVARARQKEITKGGTNR